jgi:hypothetical protein
MFAAVEEPYLARVPLRRFVTPTPSPAATSSPTAA